MAELARLESVLARKRHVGSNPTLSALNHADGGTRQESLDRPMKTPSFLIVLLFSLWFSQPGSAQTVVTAKLDGTINPAAADFISRSIEHAADIDAECLVILLNTPGGLLKSTRVIVSDILESRVPVVVYVSPRGSQAASAGVFITLSATVAAMAPGTNIGAASPVALEGQMDSTMSLKAMNDAAAFIRTIAEKRSRNVEWAEEAVRRAISITETEALAQDVIDLIADSEQDLLDQLDGMVVETPSGSVTLETQGAQIEVLEMDFSERILDILSDPNIAYILFMLGIYGLLFELYNPGAILPGVVGVISIILAFYSLHTLPVNYAGFALILFSVILFIAEIKVTSYGMLTVGGVVSLVLGSMMLIRSQSALEFFEISTGVIISVTLVSVAFFLLVIGLAIRAQRRKPTTGTEGIVGETGEALTVLDPSGEVRVHGEIWKAQAVSGKIKRGERIKVVRIEGFTLTVERLS